jgi:hypothetical protein
MTLDKTFRELVAHLHQTLEAVRAVRLTVSEDRPGENAILDEFEAACEETTGWVEESLHFGQEASGAVSVTNDLQRTRRSLAHCHSAFAHAQQRFAKVFQAYDSLRSLDEFASEHGKAWPGWFQSVQQGVQRCAEPMYETASAIAQCWEELSERLGSAGVTVTATNIGQQVSHPDALFDAAGKGIT